MAWKLYGATSTGDHHQDQGRPCADVVGCLNTPHVSLALITDGAGSIRGSSRFAQALKESVFQYVRQDMPTLTQQEALADYLRKLYAHVRATGALMAMPGDATLLILILTKRSLAFLQVGDGFCVVQKNGHLKLLSPPSLGDYVNETDFVKGLETPYIFTLEADGIDFFALSSDGLAHVAINMKTYEPHPPFFKPFQEFLAQDPAEEEVVESLQSFLDSKALHQRVKDDMSFVVGARFHE